MAPFFASIKSRVHIWIPMMGIEEGETDRPKDHPFSDPPGSYLHDEKHNEFEIMNHSSQEIKPASWLYLVAIVLV